MKRLLYLIAILIISNSCFAQVSTQQKENKDYIYNAGELSSNPSYPSGISDFFNYIKVNFNYKNLTADYDPKMTLRVYIQLTIEKDGSIGNIQILRDPGFNIGNEVTRIIKLDKTKWVPGTIDDNQTVKAYCNLPITILPEQREDINTVEQQNSNVFKPDELTQKPEYPGGLNKFYKYVKSHIDYKNISNDYKKKNLTLRVYLSFVIEKDGSINDVKILRDPGYGIGLEIKRVFLSDVTKWSPGIKNGETVRTEFHVPVTF